ncbi:uncharacterized protein isoform X2 [Leptinotarsa decemlineata]|uniref:uncharacterized protein isoform X2 n=1 Tax=Leptinotarsa decemlineata TaxID=7539 RepID=UPI003D30D16F
MISKLGIMGDTCEPNSDNNKPKIDLEDEEDEKEKIDQSQQTTPTSPNNSGGQMYMLDSSLEEEKHPEDVQTQIPGDGSPVSGILKGGRLWRQLSKESNPSRLSEQLMKTDSTSDDDSSTTRTVRFIEEEKKDSCKTSPEADSTFQVARKEGEEVDEPPSRNGSPSSEATEMMLTFKLGNHVLISNNSLKPNSAVRQLFPCTKPLTQKEEEQQYLVTAESLRAFEEAKRSKLPQIIQSAGTNDSIKRVIERNTLRRSLVRYEPKSRKNIQKTDNSLVERIKQLTCDIDEGNQNSDELSARVSPTGEEGSNAVDTSQIPNKCKERNFSPSSSSTTSSNSSSMSSTYRKITDLFGKRGDKSLEPLTHNVTYEPKAVQTQTLPDLGGPFHQEVVEKTVPKGVIPNNESRKQFLSTLAPLTACVSNVGHPDDHYYRLSNHGSVGSSTGSEYTLEDIDEALANEENKKITPDVLAGTPASESGDELVVFVQQDANRIERIKKKYENDSNAKKDDDDEHDDYGFNRRPSVRGIKPRFGSTTEILQQIQNQIHLPPPNANVAWPYYSETGINRGGGDEDSNRANAKLQHYQTGLPMDKVASYAAPTYRPVSLQDNQYQSCGNQTCYKEVYKTQSSVIGVEIDCQSMPKIRNGRPMSPPPQDLSRNFHQTMVYIPYNHIESYEPANVYQTNDYYRYNQNQMNKKYVEPIYQQKMAHVDDPYCNSNVHQTRVQAKNVYANNYQPLLVTSSRSESPLMGNYAMARSTQTSMACLSSCNYYQTPSTILRYRESIHPPYKPEYVNKVNRHSFPSVRPRYNPPENSDHIYMEDPDIQHNGPIMNGYYNYLPPKDSPGNSPTKARFIERGVPEGAASVSPQDSINLQNNSSTNTSPTLAHTNAKPLFYAMNV